MSGASSLLVFVLEGYNTEKSLLAYSSVASVGDLVDAEWVHQGVKMFIHSAHGCQPEGKGLKMRTQKLSFYIIIGGLPPPLPAQDF